MSRWTRRVLFGSLSLAAVACTVLVNVPDVPPLAQPRPDANGDASADAFNPCPSAGPPPRPLGDDPSDAGEQTFVVAVHSLDMGATADAGADDSGSQTPFGYDLDQISTCCQSAADSCLSDSGPHCDGDGGRDNSGGQLVGSLFRLSSSFNQDTINQRIGSGLSSILIQVQHYNGTANDTSVTVSVLGSEIVEQIEAGAPRWDGTDSWTVNSDFVVAGLPDGGPILPKHADTQAYVSGGVLVAAIDFPLSLSKIIVKLSGGIITGTLVPAGTGAYRVGGGQIAGRWATRDILAEFSFFYVFGQPVCPGTGLYDNFKGLVCQGADITADEKSDRTGAACDALSFGIGFAADPARMGRIVPPAVRPINCPDAASVCP